MKFADMVADGRTTYAVRNAGWMFDEDARYLFVDRHWRKLDYWEATRSGRSSEPETILIPSPWASLSKLLEVPRSVGRKGEGYAATYRNFPMVLLAKVKNRPLNEGCYEKDEILGYALTLPKNVVGKFDEVMAREIEVERMRKDEESKRLSQREQIASTLREVTGLYEDEDGLLDDLRYYVNYGSNSGLTWETLTEIASAAYRKGRADANLLRSSE